MSWIGGWASVWLGGWRGGAQVVQVGDLACLQLTELDAMQAIYQHWWDGWDHDVPCSFTNEAADAAPTWARFHVQHTVSEQMTTGPAPFRQFERKGRIFVQLFSAVDEGRGHLSGLADLSRGVLENARIVGQCGAVRTGDAYTVELADDPARYGQVVVVDFRYVEQR